MEHDLTLHTIAHIHSDFHTKFGIPRQSGIVPSLEASIVFTPPYRNQDAVKQLEEFSYIWIIWGFSEVKQSKWSPTVRPPLLGGNTRVGVFATRSPFRPNPIGLSSVQLHGISFEKNLGPVLHVRGADLMDGTPIYDIKPYLPYVDAHPEASGGFTAQKEWHKLSVRIARALLALVPLEKQAALMAVLEQDPRPSYQNDSTRVYAMEFAELEIHFLVQDSTLTVTDITPLPAQR